METLTRRRATHRAPYSTLREALALLVTPRHEPRHRAEVA